MKKNTIQANDMKRARPAPARANRRAGAAAERLLTYVIVLFQISAFSLIALKSQPVDMQALIMAAAFPLGTLLLKMLIDRVWHVDRILYLLTMALCSIGMVMLEDITKPVTALKQAIFFAPAIGAMLIAIVIMRRVTNWEKLMWPAMAVSAVIMLLPMMPVIGGWTNGARNWVTLKKLGVDVGFQPSEFVKILLLWVLSAAFAQKRGFKRMIPALAFAVAMCLILLIVQRDLGTLLIYFFLTIGMFYAATSNLMLTGIGLAGGCVGAVGAYHLFDHVKTRVDIWINPWSDTQDKGYQIVQALIAISSGGLFGLGLGLGTPRMIPYYHTDFIFAAICEEFGIIFAVGMLALYCFLIMRGLRIALEASTAFHSLMALGATLMLAVQTFVIVGGVTKMIPLTGVTLPFASAGGSSLISCMAMIGILLGVSSLNRQERARALRS